MRILAFDPGKRTGIAQWNDGRFTSDIMDAYPAMVYAEEAIIGWMNLDLVVCEDFIITAQTLKKNRGENWSLEQLGVLRFLCTREDREFKTYSPAEGIGFGKNKLKPLGWYKPGEGHDNSAACHLLKALADEDPPAFEALVRAKLLD